MKFLVIASSYSQLAVLDEWSMWDTVESPDVFVGSFEDAPKAENAYYFPPTL